MTEDDVEIRWTTGGVPHIRAADWYSLGFGQGVACARDNVATIWDAATKVRSERSRFWGAGAEDNFVASDLGYLALGLTARAAALRDAQSPDVAAMVRGYVAGCNRALEDARAAGTLPPWCADAAWLVPLDELDLYRVVVDVGLMASGRNLVGLIGRAEAPGPDGPCPPAPLSALGAANAASNGWAFGSEVTASGGGMVVANPHFPWYGEARFWECHLTIPGEIDVYGVSLIGLPGVQIGFNATLGWTHTFSRGNRFTLYRLDLAPDDPTSYRFGDDVRPMTPAEYTVTVAESDGSTREVRRTLWSSHHGPMVNLPLLGWSDDVAFTYRDANIDNTGMLELFLGMDRARDVDELAAVLARTKAMPWLNTLAADARGRTFYGDVSATPNISAAAQARYRERLATDPIAALLADNRVPLLDGSDPDDEWVDAPGARAPGLIPHDDLPVLVDVDYVVNCNDSHWLTNPDHPLEGYSVLHGFERTPRSLRTRQNLVQVRRLVAGSGVTPAGALADLLVSECLSAPLLRDGVVARLGAAGRDDMARILAAWDGTVGTDAVGAVLWRELLAAFGPPDRLDAGGLFSVPFDPDDPVATPHTLAPPVDGFDPVVVALDAALGLLERAGVAADARLGDVQWTRCGDIRVPVPGGGEVEGVANVLAPLGALASHSLVPTPEAPEVFGDRVSPTGLGPGGYQVTYGTSWLMAVEFTTDGPDALGLLAYGQAEDTDTSAAVDAARALGDGAFRRLAFSDEAIDADPGLVVEHVVPS